MKLGEAGMLEEWTQLMMQLKPKWKLWSTRQNW